MTFESACDPEEIMLVPAIFTKSLLMNIKTAAFHLTSKNVLNNSMGFWAEYPII
jgi:hypothetical protein